MFARFRDADGNESAVINDTITLQSATLPPSDSTGPRAVKLTPAAGAKGGKSSTKVKVKAGEPLEASSVIATTVS